jgi:Protein of unknown function (DUF3224)
VGSHLSRRLGITTAALLLASGGQLASAAPRDDGGHGTRQVAFTSTLTPVGGDFACDPTDPTRCTGTFRTVRTLSGDLAGTAYATGSAVLLADGTYQGQAIVQFTGTVAGCGQGTLLMLEVGVLDPAAGTSAGTWTIVAGQGTGDLASTTGDGEADGTTPVTTGRVRCS